MITREGSRRTIQGYFPCKATFFKLNIMVQVVKITDGERYRMYSALDKEDLIKMLIECNKHLERLTPQIRVSEGCFYMNGLDTSGKCSNCGKQQWEH